MRRVVSESQFVEAVYRHYKGDTLSEIASDFGVGQSTLTELRKRRVVDWERIRQKIIDAEIARLCCNDLPFRDASTRESVTLLLKYLVSGCKYSDILPKFCAELGCTAEEAETHIITFESLLPVKIPR